MGRGKREGRSYISKIIMFSKKGEASVYILGVMEGGFKSFCSRSHLMFACSIPISSLFSCLFLLTAHFDIPWSCVSLEVEHY